MKLTLPNYSFYGNPSADSARFVRSDDSAMHRKDVTFSRKQGVFNAQTQTASVPEYRIVFRKDAQVGDPAVPNGQRLSFDLTIRTPLQPSNSDAQEALEELKSLLAQEDFLAVVMAQLFPCVPCEDDSVAP